MKRTYRATLGPQPFDTRRVEPDPKRAVKLARLIERYIHLPTAPRGRAPGAVDLSGMIRAVHDMYGCLTRPMAEYLAHIAELFPAQVYGTASFYTDIYLAPKGRNLIRVCTGTTCHVAGADKLVAACGRLVGGPVGATDPEGNFTYFTAACVGACSLAPVLIVNDTLFGRPDPAALEALVAPFAAQDPRA